MATLPVRRSSGRNLTVANPTRGFEDIYDRMGQHRGPRGSSRR